MIVLNLEDIVELCEKAVTEKNWFNDCECTKNLDHLFSMYAKKLNLVAQYKSHPKEFLGIDMVWWDGERLIATIEYENVPKTNPIKDEWKKLLHVDADYKILISYCSNEEERQIWINSAKKSLENNPKYNETEKYFLILGDKNSWKFRGFKILKE